MPYLKGKNSYLRALEAEDIDFLYRLENNPDIWEISGTLTPYSRHVLKNYLDNSHRDLHEVKQLRLCICRNDHTTVGLIDLFDFDSRHRRAGIGIIVSEEEHRNKGVGSEAISLLLDYSFSVLNLHQLYANVLEDNLGSIHLFKKMGFTEVGVKKDWMLSQNGFKNEILFQKINP